MADLRVTLEDVETYTRETLEPKIKLMYDILVHMMQLNNVKIPESLKDKNGDSGGVFRVREVEFLPSSTETRILNTLFVNILSHYGISFGQYIGGGSTAPYLHLDIRNKEFNLPYYDDFYKYAMNVLVSLLVKSKELEKKH